MPTPTAAAAAKLTTVGAGHPRLVREPLSFDDAAEIAGALKVLSDPVRLRLLSLIAVRGDDGSCVCDLAENVEVSQPTISHHLKKLREAGIVDGERRGTWVYYRALPSALARLSALLNAAPVAS